MSEYLADPSEPKLSPEAERSRVIFERLLELAEANREEPGVVLLLHPTDDERTVNIELLPPLNPIQQTEDHRHAVVFYGVAPKGFDGASPHFMQWLYVSATYDPSNLTSPNDRWHIGFHKQEMREDGAASPLSARLRAQCMDSLWKAIHEDIQRVPDTLPQIQQQRSVGERLLRIAAHWLSS